MCLVTAAVVTAAVVSAGTAVATGIQQGNAAHYQAQVARNNALIQQQNAQYSAGVTAANAQASGLKQRERLAEIRASQAANGIDVSTGSASDIQDSTHKLGLLDTKTVTNNSALRVYGYQSEATSSEAQARLSDAEGDFAPIAGGLKAAGSLASAAGSFASASGGGIQSTSGAVDSMAALDTSLISGAPTIGSDYDWMRDGSSGSGQRRKRSVQRSAKGLRRWHLALPRRPISTAPWRPTMR